MPCTEAEFPIWMATDSCESKKGTHWGSPVADFSLWPRCVGSTLCLGLVIRRFPLQSVRICRNVQVTILSKLIFLCDDCSSSCFPQRCTYSRVTESACCIPHEKFPFHPWDETNTIWALPISSVKPRWF